MGASRATLRLLAKKSVQLFQELWRLNHCFREQARYHRVNTLPLNESDWPDALPVSLQTLLH